METLNTTDENVQNISSDGFNGKSKRRRHNAGGKIRSNTRIQILDIMANKVQLDHSTHCVFEEQVNNITCTSIVDPQDMSLASSRQEVSNEFYCSLFENLKICVDMPCARDLMIMESIEKHGGKISFELNKNMTDIFLVAQPSGLNFQNARLLDIPCVSPAWVEKSVKTGAAVPFEHFLIKEEKKDQRSNQDNMNPLDGSKIIGEYENKKELKAIQAAVDSEDRKDEYDCGDEELFFFRSSDNILNETVIENPNYVMQ